MKIALPVSAKSMNADLYDSLGRAPFFLLYNLNTKETDYLDHRAVAEQGASGIRAAQVLADNGVRAVITPQCGKNAEKILRNSEVLVYQSIPGSIQRNVEAFQKEELNLMTDFKSRKIDK